MVFILFLILLLLVVYQNCGVPPRVSPGTVKKLSEADLTALQALNPTEKKILCESSSFYSCTHEIWGPDAQDGLTSNYSRCLELSGLDEKFCISISMRLYRTEALFDNCQNCTPEDIEPGGKFNRESVTCFNHAIQVSSNFPIRAESEGLEKAVEKVIGICRDTLQY